MRAAAALAIALLCAGTAAGAPPVPTGFGAYPRYSAPAERLIVVQWNEVAGATRYDIYRGVDGGPLAAVATNPPFGTGAPVRHFDRTVSDTSTYTYRVDACDASGCASTTPFTTSLKVVWPISGGHEVMHGYNEVSAWNGVRGGGDGAVAGYHDGVDLNRSTPEGSPGDDVLAPRGGTVVAANITGVNPDNGFVAVAVEVGPFSYEYDSFNHIATSPGNTPVVAGGDFVAPGQKLARIGTTHFTGQSSDHVHSMVTVGNAIASSARHFLQIFTLPGDRDPQSNPPALFDENQDGKHVLFRRHGSPSLLPYEVDSLPLDGDIDIAVEVTDQQGTNPRQAPIDLGYWIEGALPDSLRPDDVRSAQAPYRLYDFRTAYFGALPVLCSSVSLIQEVANPGCGGIENLGCVLRNITACNSLIKEGTREWAWPVLHHFIVTNTKSTTGAPADVDATQFWRTNAEDDGQPVTVPTANFANRPTTTRATHARFPDGLYTIHAVASDLVHDKVDLPIPDIRLENFAPYVREVLVAQDLDGLAATGINGCEGIVYEYTHPGRKTVYPGPNYLLGSQTDRFARAGRPLCVRVRFSETMADATVTLFARKGLGIPLASLSVTATKEFRTADTWSGKVTLPTDPSGDSDSSLADDANDVAVRVTGHDLVSRDGAQRGLDADGDGTPDALGDLNHRFKIDLSPPKRTVEILKVR